MSALSVHIMLYAHLFSSPNGRTNKKAETSWKELNRRQKERKGRVGWVRGDIVTMPIASVPTDTYR